MDISPFYILPFLFAFRNESEGRYAPAPDVLHSGLTNDVMSLGMKRDDLGKLQPLLLACQKKS